MTIDKAVKELRALHECQVETGNTRSAKAIEAALALMTRPKRRNFVAIALNDAAKEALDFFEVCDDPEANRVAHQLRAARAKARKAGY